MKPKQPMMTIPGQIHIDYNWSPGKAGERFFRDLKESKKIMGTRCRKCHRVLVPPRSFCEECFTDDMEWVEVKPTGTLSTFGDCYFSTDGKPLKEPWILGIVKLDGADGGLIHFIGEAKADELYIGMPMEIVFNKERQGNIMDIRYFRPIRK